MTSLDDLVLPAEGWRLHEQDDESRAWFGPTGVAIRVLRLPGPSPVPVDVEAARARYTADSGAMGGALIEVERVDTAAGPALRSVLKYRALPNPLAIYYVGIVLVDGPDAHFRVHTEAVESGTTGVREALVMAVDPDAWPRVEAPAEVVDGDELLDRLGSSPLRRIPSDDPRWDEQFPDHPLSRVRAQQREIVAGLRTARRP